MIRTILTALREARQIREYIVMADKGEFWQPIDGAALVRYMIGASGQKLRARLNAMVYKSAIKACSVTDNGDYERGIARGVLLAVQALDQHMDVTRQPSEQDFAESTGVLDDIPGLVDLSR